MNSMTESSPIATISNEPADDISAVPVSVDCPAPSQVYNPGYTISLSLPLEDTFDSPLFNIITSPYWLPLRFVPVDYKVGTDPTFTPEMKFFYAYTSMIQPDFLNSVKYSIVDKSFWNPSDFQRLMHRYHSGEVEITMLLATPTTMAGKLKIGRFSNLTRPPPRFLYNKDKPTESLIYPFESSTPLTQLAIQGNGFVTADLCLNKTVAIKFPPSNQVCGIDYANFSNALRRCILSTYTYDAKDPNGRLRTDRYQTVFKYSNGMFSLSFRMVLFLLAVELLI